MKEGRNKSKHAGGLNVYELLEQAKLIKGENHWKDGGLGWGVGTGKYQVRKFGVRTFWADGNVLIFGRIWITWAFSFTKTVQLRFEPFSVRKFYLKKNTNNYKRRAVSLW